jgi:transposase
VGAPRGERYGKGKKYPDWLVKAVLMEHYDYGVSRRELSKILNIPYDTITDWVGYQTRVVR